MRFFLIIALLSTFLQAQDSYPSKPIEMIVSFGKGGSSDNNNNAQRIWMDKHSLVKTRVMQFISNADYMIDSVNKALSSQAQLYGGTSKGKQRNQKNRNAASDLKIVKLSSEHLIAPHGDPESIRGGPGSKYENSSLKIGETQKGDGTEKSGTRPSIFVANEKDDGGADY